MFFQFEIAPLWVFKHFTDSIPEGIWGSSQIYANLWKHNRKWKSSPHFEKITSWLGYPNESFQATGDRLSLFQFREKDRLMDQATLATLLGVRETPLITKKQKATDRKILHQRRSKKAILYE